MRVCIAKTRRNEYAKDGHRAYRETVFFHSIVSIIRDLVKEDHQEWAGTEKSEGNDYAKTFEAGD